MKPEIGRAYGYRKEMRATGQPLLQAMVLKLGPPKSKQVRIKWISGEFEGMEEWINPLYLLCPWEESSAFIHDEIRLSQVINASNLPANLLERDSVDEVFSAVDATFYTEWSTRKNGILVIDRFPEPLIALKMDPEPFLSEPFSFVDRKGTYYATYESAKKLALHLCGEKPERIISYEKKELQSYNEESLTSRYFSKDPWYREQAGREFLEKQKRDQESVFEIISAWCGRKYVEQYDKLEDLENELIRLRNLLIETLDWMKDTAKQQDLRWLRLKYISLYKELTGENPPDIKCSN